MLNFGNMAKEEKKQEPKKRGKYEPPLKVEGDFMELMGAVVKDAKKKDKKKEQGNDEQAT